MNEKKFEITIECPISLEELIYLADIARKSNESGCTVHKVYRNKQGLNIQLSAVILSEQKE